MPIVGTTVGEDGRPIVRLPVTRKIACGLGPSSQRSHPERLFKFLFMSRGSAKQWVLDPATMKRFYPDCEHKDVTEQCEKCCTEVKVTLISDPISDGKGNLDFEDILRTSLTWWGRSGWKCKGDGVNAIRKTESKPEGQPWSPCKLAGCPDWDVDCQASGDLYCVLGDEAPSGGVSRIHTSSEWSIRNIHSALVNICSYTGNRLAGVTIPLRVTKEKATPTDKRTGKTMETWVPILSVGGSIRQVIEDSKKSMELYEQARKMFGGRALTPFEDESDLAVEIPKEFPSPKDAQRALPEGKPEEKKLDPPTDTRPTAAPSGGVDKPGEAKPEPVKTEAPKKPEIQKAKQTFEGIPKKLDEATIQNGNRKGQYYWRLQLAMAAGEGEFLVFSSTVRDKLAEALKKGQEVELPCEVRIGPEKRAIIVEDVKLLAKPVPQEEPASPDWMLE